MSVSFDYKALSLAVVAGLAATTAQAAGLDRSGQDVTAFLQDGTYAEFVYTYIDADVAGHDNGVAGGAALGNYVKGNATGDSAEAYDFFRFGGKADVNDRVSVGVLYDEPFGAAVQYHGDNNFVQKSSADVQAGVVSSIVSGTPAQQAQARQLIGAAQLAEAQGKVGEGTNVEIRTNNVTGLVGVKLGENRNFQVYGGPAVQRLNGEVHLRGIAYQGAQGYDARISTDTDFGWVAGVAYSKPEIALKAALTYRSEIEHESTIAEVFPLKQALGANPASARNFSVTLPESFNLDFQTGINPTTLLTAKVRYVPWSDFDIRPPAYGDAAERVYGKQLPIVSYDKDQWSAEVGLGKRLSDRLAVSGSVGWDSGAGNPTTTLGPIEGYYSVGLGAKYDLTPQWSLAVGGKYLKFGDADAQIPPQVGTSALSGRFEDNDGFIAGVKLAYQAK